MAQSWWKDVITQAFNPPVEPGEDIGTPFHTPVTALESGRIESVTYGGFGARIDVAEGGSTVVYYQHLDEVAPGLHAGSQITAGEQLGLSGGQLSGGNLPNSPQNSSGPHIEVGETVGGAPVNPSQLIAAGPQTSGQQFGAEASSVVGSGGGFDPWGFLQNVILAPFKVGQQAGETAAAVTAAAQDPAQTAGLIAGDTAAGFAAGAFTGTQQALSGFYSSSAGPWLKENIIPLVVAALIILVVLGAGNKTTQTQTQMVPIPVPV